MLQSLTGSAKKSIEGRKTEPGRISLIRRARDLKRKKEKKKREKSEPILHYIFFPSKVSRAIIFYWEVF